MTEIEEKTMPEEIEEKEMSEKIEEKAMPEETQIKQCQDLTAYFGKSDHSVNKFYQTKVPQICKDEPCQLGVDEAGRGPVLGPMLYGIAYAPLSKKQLLVDLGCADSKTLTEEERDTIFNKICDNHEEIGWIVEAISPNIISNSMYRRVKCSLNEVSKNSAVGMIKMALEAGVNVTEVYVDTVGKPEKYQAYLKEIFPEISKIIVAKKADSTYPIVSAASICAKVSRDHALNAWEFREGEFDGKYGSGYPNDPATKTWLTDNIDNVFGFPQLVRFSWSTAEIILKKEALAVEWEEEDNENVPKKQKKMTSFFTQTNNAGEIVRKKHDFFKHRCLTETSEL